MSTLFCGLLLFVYTLSADLYRTVGFVTIDSLTCCCLYTLSTDFKYYSSFFNNRYLDQIQFTLLLWPTGRVTSVCRARLCKQQTDADFCPVTLTSFNRSLAVFCHCSLRFHWLEMTPHQILSCIHWPLAFTRKTKQIEVKHFSMEFGNAVKTDYDL